jgi:hypothetical protein
VGAQKHVVLQPTVPLQNADIDPFVEPVIPHAAEGRNVRLPSPPVVAEKEVVDAAPLLLADDGRGGRGSIEDQAHLRGWLAPQPQRDAAGFHGRGEIASEPRGEHGRPAPLTSVLDEIKARSEHQAARRRVLRGRYPLPVDA